MRVFASSLVAFSCVLCVASALLAQDVTIGISPDRLPLNQALRVQVEVKNGRVRSHSTFPDIQGFRKGSLSSSSTTNIVNGRISSSHSVIQSYYPTKEGDYAIPAFQLTVNGEQVLSPAMSVRVVPRQPAQRQKPFFSFGDPFDFFGRNEPQEYVDVQDDAFLGMYVNKKEAYVGEGITLSLAFYVSETNAAILQFYDISNQIAELSQRIKPANCWEERHIINDIEKKPVRIGDKAYVRYLLYRSTFYPLNADNLHIPSIPLKMLKYKVAKSPSFFGRNRQEDFKTFHSRAREVLVRTLPPHPLRDRVAVGVYDLREKLEAGNIQTGDGFTYSFTVAGEGNISSLQAPVVLEAGGLDIYPPSIAQQVHRSEGRVYGRKTFTYHVIPREPGSYLFADLFEWVYFDPRREEYVSLRPEAQFKALGESLQNQRIRVTGQNSFYHHIAAQENTIAHRGGNPLYRAGWSIFLCAILLVSGWFCFFRS